MKMKNVKQIVDCMRKLGSELQPFTQETLPGTKTWSGSEYVQAEQRSLDPYALMWWGIITTLADILEIQGESITKEQLEYLRKKVLGGMGSFQDFQINEKQFGSLAKDANGRLQLILSSLFNLISNE
ncbi:MAG TPA: hypothetical protein PK972_07265 [Deltaproteobacteria bacterium]|jgi:hypothetical protein|nr:hypothetical protein [Deltaproteobacteria bacterium]HOS27023.1 hypothetical protein [Deltaproteobacteria bacterium]